MAKLSDLEAVLGYIGAFIIGLILGLMGGGGSILTVPLLVYALGVSPVIATAYSLFIVGTTSAFGAAQNYYKDNLAVKTGLMIALPSFIAVYLTRRYIVPALPEILTYVGSEPVYRDPFIMVLFALIMTGAAISLIFKKSDESASVKKLSYIYVLPLVILIGAIMGLVGSGGGFMFIPMLVFFGGLPMKKAVGTSLLIIALNSLTGFIGDLQNISINWSFLLSFSVVSVFGIFAGSYLHRYINENQLKRGFGWFILLMAAFILAKEFIGF